MSNPMSNPQIELDQSALDPNIVLLGRLAGIFNQNPDNTNGTVTLNTDWFSDPLAHLKNLPSERGAELLRLLDNFLGSVAGNSLGTPKTISGLNWHPIRNPVAAASNQQQSSPTGANGNGGPNANPVTDATGLYLVTRQTGAQGAASSDGDGRITIGLGLLYPFTSGAITLTTYAYFPLLQLPPSGSSYFVFGTSDDPVELGFELSGTTGTFGNDVVSFDGLKVAMDLYFNGQAPQPEIVLLNLMSPDQSQPGDLSLIELVADSRPDQWVKLALSILAGQLSQAANASSPYRQDAAAMIYDLLALLGLADEIPSFDWNGLKDNPSQIISLISNWFRALASSPVIMKRWLSRLHDAFAQGVSNLTDDKSVNGSGTRAAPWTIQLAGLSNNLTLSFTVAAETDVNGNLSLYPGFRAELSTIQPIASLNQLGAQAAATVELVQLTLPAQGSPTSVAFPSFELKTTLLNPDSGPLFAVDDTTNAPSATGAHSAAVTKKNGFSIEAIEFGLAYNGLISGSVPAPSFSLKNVNTALGSWAEVNLSNFDQPVKLIEDLLTTLVEQSLTNFLNPASATANAYAESLAVILGLSAPPEYQGAWPVAEMLINNPDALNQLVADPLGALGRYYTRCLTTNVGDASEPVWKYLLPHMAQLLGGEIAPVSGSGSADAPWQITLLSLGAGSAGVYLQAWQAEASPVNQPNLHLALFFDVPLSIPFEAAPLREVIAGVGLSVELLSVNLPDEMRSLAANWLPGLALQLHVSGAAADKSATPLQTPVLAGVSLQADEILLAVGWNKPHGFYWQTDIDGAALAYQQDNSAQSIGTISFSSQSPFVSEQQVSELTQAAVNIAGLWLLEHGGKFGLTLASALGLLPTLPSVINGSANNSSFELPPGLSLPANWPVLQLSHPSTFLTQPWSDLRHHLGQLFSSAAFAEPLMRLIGWAITGVVRETQQPAPAGTQADPWLVKLPNVWGLELLVWTESGTSAGGGSSADAIGVGLRKPFASQSGPDVQIETVMRLDIARINLNGSDDNQSALPVLEVTCNFVNPQPDKPLVFEPETGLSIGSAQLGVKFGPSGISPVLTLLEAQLSSSAPAQIVELTPGSFPVFTCQQGIEVLETLLDRLMARLIAASGALPQLQAMFAVLSDLELAQTESSTGAAATTIVTGLNRGAWSGLLANPGDFLTVQMKKVLRDPQLRAELYSDLAALIGHAAFQLPAHLNGLQPLLASLRLLQAVPEGYALALSSWLQFMQHPVQYLQQQGTALLSSPDARRQLTTALSKLTATLPPAPASGLSLTVNNGTKIVLTLAEPVNIGTDLQVSGAVVLDLQALSLSVDVALSSMTIGSALAFQYQMLLGADGQPVGPSGNAGGSWGLLLQAAPSTNTAPFTPLQIYPIPDINAYLDQLGEQIPLFVLSSITSKILNEFVLKSHPLVANIFSMFGLTAEDAQGVARIDSMLGIFMHPVAWLLSPQVLGDGNNHLDLTKLGALLSKLPGAASLSAPYGITLTPTSSGLTLSGLPYGMNVALHSDATSGVSIGLALQPQTPAPAPCVKINGGLSFGLGAGVAVHGSNELIFDLTKNASISDPCNPPATDTLLHIAASYNEAVPHAFALSLTAHKSGQDYPVTLLPFTGLNQFLPGAAQTDKLLGFVAQKLSAAYASNETQIKQQHPDLDALIQSFIALGQDLGITDVPSLMSTVAELRSAPLKWLYDHLLKEQVTSTLDALNNLLSQSLKLPGFTRESSLSHSNLIQFTPPLSSPPGAGALTISFGTQTNGGETFFGMWVQARASKDWLFLKTDTGVAVALPSSSNFANPTYEFTLEAGMGLDLTALEIPQLTAGPELTLALDYGNTGAASYTLKVFPLGQPRPTDPAPPAEVLYLDLLPQPAFTIEYLSSPAQPASHDVPTWLRAFAARLLMPLMADIVLVNDAVTIFLNHPIGADSATLTAQPLTPGTVLKQWGLLTQAASRAQSAAYQLADLIQTFSKLTPTEIVENLLYAALSSLPADFQLLSLADKGGIYIVSAPNQSGGTDLGLRLQVTDLPLGGSSNSTTQFLVQLGKWQSADDAAHPWLRRADPDWLDEPLGVSFYLLRVSSSGTSPSQHSLSLHPQLKLVSVGVDVQATGNMPLVNLKGVRLGGFEPRIYLSLDDGGAVFGASIQCDDLGLPLGPRFGSSAGSNNPVAQNLLASSSGNGSSNDGGSAATDGTGTTDAVNPVFSLSASYLHKFDFQLYGGQPGDPTGTIWFPVQRSFGPLNCRKVGIAWQGADATPADMLSLLYDGGVALAGLTLNLDNLSVGIPVTSPADYESYQLELGGLDISFVGGPVEISGGLLKSIIPPDTITYTGNALIQAQKYTLSGAGSYAVLKGGQPSLFIFAMLNQSDGKPMGGPPFFFVTGVAAGFGYNRDLIIPAQDQVQNFPLVAGSADPGVFQNQDPLQVLNRDVPPRLGAYWLAAGVQFTSFELINSSALLVVKFGREFEIALLGLSHMTLPKADDGANPCAYAELSLEVTFKPSTGLLAVTMVLSPNSYVLDRDCQLTGGFAFYIWFSGQYKGDFVVTLGGYHPSFTPPDYYPLEPRLGFNWQVSSDITIKGGAYFALTPSCIMAGGELEATYETGNLRAWFDAQADFLIAWKPFHYDVYISISIGASYTIHFIISKTFSVELGASLHIWGPRLQGVVHVHWWVISFSVSFGSDGDSNQSSTIGSWSDFYTYFLASQDGDEAHAPQQLQAFAQTAAQTDPTPTQSVCLARVAGGLMRQVDDAKYGKIWIVRADEFVLATETKIPATQVVLTSGASAAQNMYMPADASQIQPIGIRPMEQPTVAAQHTISIIGEDGIYCDLAQDWSWELDTSGVPAALWDHNASNGQLAPDSKNLPGRLVGVKSGTVNPYQPPVPPPPIDILSTFSFVELTPHNLPLAASAPAGHPPTPDDNSLDVIQNKIMSPPVIDFRNAVLNSIASRGYDVHVGGRLDILAATAQTTFQSPPMLGSLDLSHKIAEATPGRTVNVAQCRQKKRTLLEIESKTERPATCPRVRALIRQHAHPNRSLSSQAEQSQSQPKTSYRVSGKVHSASIFSRQQELQAIQGVHRVRETDECLSAQRMTLHAGATLLWDCQSAGGAKISLRLDGNLPMRVVTLDLYHNVLADEVLETREVAYALPSNAAHLSLTALRPSDNRAASARYSGWHSTSSLVQVTHKVLLGERAVVIPQSANRIPARRKHSRGPRLLDHGLSTGADMVAQNLVKMGPSELRPGWIETLLPSSTRTIAVMLKRAQPSNIKADDLAESLRVTMPLIVQDGAEQRVEYTTLVGDEFVMSETERLVLFAVPEPELQATQRYLQVRVETDTGWMQEGIIGSAEHDDVQSLRAEWQQIVLEPSGVSHPDWQDILTEIEMVSRDRA